MQGLGGLPSTMNNQVEEKMETGVCVCTYIQIYIYIQGGPVYDLPVVSRE